MTLCSFEHKPITLNAYQVYFLDAKTTFLTIPEQYI